MEKENPWPHVAVGCWKIVGSIILILLAIIWRGWLLTIMWGWFTVPIFGLPALTLGHGCAVMLMVAFMSPINMPTDEDKKKSFVARIAFGMFTSSALLGFGWIVHTWIM